MEDIEFNARWATETIIMRKIINGATIEFKHTTHYKYALIEIDDDGCEIMTRGKGAGDEHDFFIVGSSGNAEKDEDILEKEALHYSSTSDLENDGWEITNIVVKNKDYLEEYKNTFFKGIENPSLRETEEFKKAVAMLNEQ